MGKKDVNILVTTMSVTRFERHEYQGEIDGETKICDGYTSMEPVSKYILAKEHIDRIVAIGTKETYQDGDDQESGAVLPNDKNAVKGKTTEEEYIKEMVGYDPKTESTGKYSFRVYERHIADYLLDDYAETEGKKSQMSPHPDNVERAKNGEFKIRFVPEQKEDGEDNIAEIVRALSGNEDENIHLYMDVQGGLRTAFYVRHAVLDILCNQYDRIKLEGIYAINFDRKSKEPSEIIDEKKRYRILDLVSGMNAFLRYGKADDIAKYCAEMNVGGRAKDLVDRMGEIDSAISLCDVNALEQGIRNLRSIELKKENAEDRKQDFSGNVFSILVDGIKRDYGSLLELDPKESPREFYPELIKWCARKGFVQQALTLIEDKMPAVYLNDSSLDKGGLIQYRIKDIRDSDGNSVKSEDFFSCVGAGYESRPENKLFAISFRVRNKGLDRKKNDYPSQIANEKKSQLNDLIKRQKNDREKARESLKSDLKRAIEVQNDKIKNTIIMNYWFFHILKEYDANTGNGFGIGILSRYLCCSEFASDKSPRVEISGTDKERKKVTFNVQFEFHTKYDNDRKRKERLEYLLLLHEALRKERNCCNHASEKEIRLPLVVVKRAIDIYWRETQELLNPSAQG